MEKLAKEILPTIISKGLKFCLFCPMPIFASTLPFTANPDFESVS